MKVDLIIDNLLVADEAKNVLRTVSKIANSDDMRIRSTIPSLLVVSEIGCGVTSYGEAYGKIIESSPVLRIKGMRTFVELVFPKDNQQDEKLFFSSPQRAASVRNRFYGTFLISFSEYTGMDLIKSGSFQRLLEFIEMNKMNIQFLFHVLPGFTAKAQLISGLGEILNITEVSLEKPGMDKAFDYVLAEMNRMGFAMNEEWMSGLKEKLLPIVVNSEMYWGYKTLNNMIRRMTYELAVGELETSDALCQDIIDKVARDYKLEKNGMNSRMGFHI